MKKRYLYIILISILFVGCTHLFDGVEDNTPIGNMECLWKTIDEKYCFVEEKGVDWQKVHDTTLTKVKQLKEDDYLGLFDALAEMINTLEDGHVNLYSGFDVSKCQSWYKDYPANFDWDRIQQRYLTHYRTAGGLKYTTLANGKVGYVYCGSFENSISAANITYILKEMKDCQGMIVDVRNNGGGSMDYAYKFAATFFDEEKTVGYWQHKNGAGHDDFSALVEQRVHPQDMPSKWLREVVVLSNRHSYSATNFFISAMRYCGRATIVGGKSGGGGGMPLSYELPNGWICRFSSIRMTDADKNSIEPGINPDVAVVDLPETEQDEIIEKAINIILKRR